MKVRIDIDGKRQKLDLARVHYINELERGEKVVTRHPDTRELCIAVVSFDMYGHLWLTDSVRELAPYRWMVSKRNVYGEVYKINPV